MLKVPLLKFPVSVLFIEDDPDFSDALSKLMKKEANFSFEASPPFPEKIKKLNSIDGIIEDLFHGDEPRVGVFTTEIHLGKLQQLKDRLDSVYPIIVSDYYLGAIDGLELFEELQDVCPQKLLVTGAADETLAIEAFNKGQIHGFLKKQIPNFAEHLRSEILRNIDRFFLGLSEKIAGSSLRGMHSLLEEEEFKSFFNSFLSQHNIKEFYALDGMGSFLLVSDRKKEIFHISSQEELTDVYESYDASLQKKLKDYSHQVIRYKGDVFSRPLENAENNLVKTERITLKGRSYFYSLVKPE